MDTMFTDLEVVTIEDAMAASAAAMKIVRRTVAAAEARLEAADAA